MYGDFKATSINYVFLMFLNFVYFSYIQFVMSFIEILCEYLQPKKYTSKTFWSNFCRTYLLQNYKYLSIYGAVDGTNFSSNETKKRLFKFSWVAYTTNKNTPKRIKISKIPFFKRFFSWRNSSPYKKGTIAPDLLMVEIIEISAPSCESAQK